MKTFITLVICLACYIQINTSFAQPIHYGHFKGPDSLEIRLGWPDERHGMFVTTYRSVRGVTTEEHIFNATPLPINQPKDIEAELLDPHFIDILAGYANVGSNSIKSFSMTRGTRARRVRLDRIGAQSSDREFSNMLNAVKEFVLERADGHTKAFLCQSITNRTAPTKVDPAVALILNEHPLLPASLFKETTNSFGKRGMANTTVVITTSVNQNAYSVTNNFKTDSAADRVFIVTDCDITWTFMVSGNRQLPLPVEKFKEDSKNFDLKYRDLFKKVDDAVTAKMTQDGTLGRRGSAGIFDQLKKEQLKQFGVEWRTSEELNPERLH